MSKQSNNGNGRQVAPVTEFRNYMTGTMRDEIAKQLPKGIDADRFIRTAVSTVQMRPELLDANRTSLFGAFMQAAKDGLLCDDKEATIQIYNTNVAPPGQQKQWVKMAQYMPMVGGLIKKMYEAGCTYVDAAAVNAEDHFKFRRGDDPGIEHEPDILSEDPGPVVAAYAIVKLPTGEIKREVMPRRDIEKVRAASKTPNGPGWSNWYDQFAIKAALKRIYKQLPHEFTELGALIEQDNEAMGFDFRQQEAKDITAIAGEGTKAVENKPGARPSRLDSIIKANGVSGQAPAEAAVPAEQPEIRF